MAVRYSGECEVRLDRSGRWLDVTVRWPRGRAHGRLRLEKKFVGKDIPSDAYDRMAASVLLRVDRRHKIPVDRSITGRVVVRRGFVAPCPA